MEAVVLYQDQPRDAGRLASMGLELMSRRQLRRANAELRRTAPSS